MPFAFLAPLFLLGLAAIVIPIVIHLREMQRRNVVEFPSLMFLEAIPYRSVQKRRIRHWALLSLRALAVILLVAAFARPFLADEDGVVSGALGPKELVVLIDRSYSMDFGDRWERTLDAARDAVSDLEPTDRASLVFFDRAAEVPVRSSSDRGRLTQALDTASVGAGLASVSGHGENEDNIYPGHRWHFPLSRMIMAAKANHCFAVDAPFGNFRDLDGLKASAAMAKALGCDGKWAIHPAQIDTINQVFSPTPEEIERASQILDAAEKAGTGRGAVAVDGKMVDQATIRLARKVRDQALHLGLMAAE